MGGVGEISELRGRIDGIDREILRLLDERTRMVREIGRVKKRLGLSVRDPERERYVIERAGEHGRVFEAILRDSVLSQRGRIGVVGGLGRMGRWMAERLSSIRKVAVYDVSAGPPPPGCFRVDSLAELLEWSDVVIVATPLGKTPEVLEEIAEDVPEGRLVFDLSTLKLRVVEALSKFPRDVMVCSVHPLFGPGAEGLEGRRVAVVPVPGREEGAAPAEELFREAGAVPVRVDPETHDRMVALTIGLAYFVGISFGLTVARWGDAERIAEIAGTSFRYLSTYSCALAGEDSSFVSELLSNPLVREAIQLYLKVCEGLTRSSGAEVDALLGELRHAFAELIDPGDAYAAFYRALDALSHIQDLSP